MSPPLKMAAYGVLGLLIARDPAAARPAPQPRPEPGPDGLVLAPVTSLKHDTFGALIGRGRPADPQQWPASFFATLDSASLCTATLVGPSVLLTAAHCIRDGGRVEIRQGTSRLGGTCHNMPGGFPTEISGDYSLCRLDAPVELSRYETMDFDPATLRVGLRLLGAGYGCTGSRGDPGTGIFRVGTLPVATLPDTSLPWPNFITTDPEASFICPGDSGGAVFLLRGSMDRRWIEGVQSHFRDERPEGSEVGRVYSYVSALSSPDGRGFARTTLAGWGEPVCARGLPGVRVMPGSRCR